MRLFKRASYLRFMSILNQLASALGRRDEAPNSELAAAIAEKNDQKAVTELVAGLQHKSKDIQSDCIKVLYEAGERNPKLIAPHAPIFVDLLESRNNRLQWGAMTALSALTASDPDAVYKALPKVIAAADKGSVITNDQCVAILIKLATIQKYSDAAFSLLLERLRTCSTNQLPMYAENAAPIVTSGQKAAFVQTLTDRLSEIEKESKRKRVEKVLKKMQ